MKDVMLDIETMALHTSNALILSIGLVEFDPTGDVLKFGKEVTIRPDLGEQLMLGRCVEDDTQRFWSTQPLVAVNDWRLGTRHTVPDTYFILRDFLGDSERLWANHINFDIANVATLIRQIGKKEPWHYRAPFDMPSFCANRPLRLARMVEEPIEGLPHTAIYDCKVQAQKVWLHWPQPEPLMHHPV